MKFRAERAEFADAASWVLRTVSSRPRLPALGGVKLAVSGDELTLSSNDMETSSEITIPVQAERDGTALVPGRLLGDVIRTLPNAAVSAEVDGDRLDLVCGAHFKLRLMPVEDFPESPQTTDPARTAVLQADEMARAVGQVAKAAAAEHSRPQLTGVQLVASADKVMLAATDSFRLAVRNMPWSQGPEADVVVPRRALEEARRSAEQATGDVTLSIEDSKVTFDFNDRRLTTRLIEGDQFPNVMALVPEAFQRELQVDRQGLAEVVRRVSVVGEMAKSTTPVTLDVSEDTVKVAAGSGDLGQAEQTLPAELSGEPIQIGFNPRLLVEGLDAIWTDRIRLEMQDEMKPAVLRPVVDDDDAEDAAEDYLYLLMPMRLP